MREVLQFCHHLHVSSLVRPLPVTSLRCSGVIANASLLAISSSSMEETGFNSEDNSRTTRSQMWAEEAGEDVSTDTCFDPLKKREWYSKGICYWQGVEASVNGVLGGYGHVNDRDIATSNGLLVEVLREALLSSENMVALDCGAGVGRVTKNLLLRHFNEVDLVEPVSHFLQAAKDTLSTLTPSSSTFGKAVNFYCTSLQEFTPSPNRYDVIWVQWCIGHLTDQDLIDFFKRAKAGLKPHGMFVVKENTMKRGFLVDKDDSSVTRSDAYYRALFEQAGLCLVKTKVQKGFPKELFPVRMYALSIKHVKLSPVAHRTRGKIIVNHPHVIA